jgi:hypothetical protein
MEGAPAFIDLNKLIKLRWYYTGNILILFSLAEIVNSLGFWELANHPSCASCTRGCVGSFGKTADVSALIAYLGVVAIGWI